jgi:hypothetical protein
MTAEAAQSPVAWQSRIWSCARESELITHEPIHDDREQEQQVPRCDVPAGSGDVGQVIPRPRTGPTVSKMTPPNTTTG